MTWNHWREHFETNRRRPLPAVTPPGDLPPALAAALAWSLARFQVGEAGEGRIVRQIARCRLAGVDADYQRALQLFVAEEGRHARILAAAVRALGGQLLATSWSERLFVFGRRLCGVRLKLLVLLAAEVIGIGFYGAMAACLPRGGLRAALEQMCGDERAHLRFHQDFFRTQAARGWRRQLFRVTWHLVAAAAALVVLWDHRRTLRLLGASVVGTAGALARLVAKAGRLEGAPEDDLQPRVTLAPVRRGEGRGEGSAVDKRRSTLAGDPLTLTLSPEDGGEGTGERETNEARHFVRISQVPW